MRFFVIFFQTLCEYWPELSSSVPIKIPQDQKKKSNRGKSRIFFKISKEGNYNWKNLSSTCVSDSFLRKSGATLSFYEWSGGTSWGPSRHHQVHEEVSGRDSARIYMPPTRQLVGNKTGKELKRESQDTRLYKSRDPWGSATFLRLLSILGFETRGHWRYWQRHRELYKCSLL